MIQGSTSAALSTIRCGRAAPSQPMRSEKRYPSGTLPNQAFRASPAPRGHRPPSGGKFELLQPRARRKGVLWAPLDELRAPVLLSTNELLWLPRSARRADGDETRSRAKSGEQVVEQIGTRLSAAHFVHADRSYQTLEAKIRLRQAAGLFRSPLLFLAQGAPKQSPRTNQRR